jgi:arsenate reductase (thioredoxin)
MNILFLCVANSARSQMAEGLAKNILGNSYNIQSAGSHASGLVHPNAILALEEIRIDISNNSSKNIEDLDESFMSKLDFVITLCAEEVCPVIPSKATKLHWLNVDPANDTYSQDQLIKAFRKTRNNIAKSITDFKKLSLQ